jgi:dTDP-4-amino-4,6-dideoxygalactose transaminase
MRATAPPPILSVFEGIKLQTPNVSGRMDNLRAAILRPQLALLPDRVARWAALYQTLEAGLSDTNGLRLVTRAIGGTLRRL